MLIKYKWTIKVEYSRKILLQVIENAHTDFLLSRKNSNKFGFNSLAGVFGNRTLRGTIFVSAARD